jgi:hypothetical protein
MLILTIPLLYFAGSQESLSLDGNFLVISGWLLIYSVRC